MDAEATQSVDIVPLPGVDEPQLCERCARIRDQATRFFARQWGRVGPETFTVAELEQNAASCSLCSYFLQIFRTDPRFEDMQATPSPKLGLHGAVGGDYTSLNPYSRHEDRLLWFYPVEDFQKHATIIPRPRENLEMPPFFSGRLVPPRISVGFLQSWLRLCYDSNGHHVCQPPPWKFERTVQFRLIDVTRACVVKAPRGSKYAALSYVWGTASIPKLEKSSYGKFTTPGAFSRENQSLPKTFVDALNLTVSLGLEFLWIDALCIVQDNAYDMTTQIQYMDQIYNSAELTVVCNSRSADDGIPGMGSYSRKFTQLTYDDGSLALITRQSFGSAMAESPWQRRAWTFQERHFSHRLLIFTETQSFFYCKAAIWLEDTVLEPHDKDTNYKEVFFKEMHLGVTHAIGVSRRHTAYRALGNASHLDEYTALVAAYTPREMSFESDALRAFDGVLNSLRPGLGDHFWGHPKYIFSESMHWRANYHDPLTRRPGFPSWSWSGWKIPNGVEIHFFPVVRFKNKVIRWHYYRRKGNRHSLWEAIDDQGIGREDPWDYDKSERKVEVSLKLSFKHIKARMPPLSHFLLFETWSLMLFIDKKSISSPTLGGTYYCVQRTKEYSYSLTDSRMLNRLVGHIILDKQWRDSHPDQCEFVVIGPANGYGCSRSMLMLIERDENDVAYRVGLVKDPVDASILEDEWLPKKKKIIALA